MTVTVKNVYLCTLQKTKEINECIERTEEKKTPGTHANTNQQAKLLFSPDNRNGSMKHVAPTEGK